MKQKFTIVAVVASILLVSGLISYGSLSYFDRSDVANTEQETSDSNISETVPQIDEPQLDPSLENSDLDETSNDDMVIQDIVAIVDDLRADAAESGGVYPQTVVELSDFERATIVADQRTYPDTDTLYEFSLVESTEPGIIVYQPGYVCSDTGTVIATGAQSDIAASIVLPSGEEYCTMVTDSVLN